MRNEIVQRAQERIATLGAISDHPDYRIRSLLSPANRRAATTIMDWMAAAGLEVTHTTDGSVRGIWPGSNPDEAPLLIGSHFDTVIDAGAYDGPLGIISALAAVEILQAEGVTLPFPIHLLGFSDEEGVRFQTTFIGSMAMVSDLDSGRLLAKDQDGKSLGSVLESEGWHDGASPIRYEKGRTRGFVELHIEQGRVLEEMELPASVVSGLVGQTRLSVVITGRADHAGTTPMPLRRDALTGAAECILELEKIADRAEAGLATVGKIEVHPGASNAIVQTTSFTIDLRHPDDPRRREMIDEAHSRFTDICKRRGLELSWKIVLDTDATPCDSCLSKSLLDSVEATTGQALHMVSGAGHDGIALSPAMPIGMVFIRCRDGLSHHPDEFASPEDVAVGIDILTHFLRKQATL